MSHMYIPTFAVVVSVFLTSIAWSQFFPYYQPFPSPQAGANTAETAGANTAATAGPTGFPGTVQRLPGQLLPNGQFVTTVQPPLNGGAVRFNQVFGAVAPSYLITPTPWFSNYALRQQLALGEIQYQNLYNAYADAYTRYNDAVAALPVGMALAEREGRLQALEETFNADVNAAVEANITDAQALQRFNDLKLKYQNRTSAGATAAQQRLALTPEQHRRLRLMAYQWSQLMENFRSRAVKDSPVSNAEYSDLRRQAQQQIEATLTAEQLPYWQQLVGPYYNFEVATPAEP